MRPAKLRIVPARRSPLRKYAAFLAGIAALLVLGGAANLVYSGPFHASPLQSSPAPGNPASASSSVTVTINQAGPSDPTSESPINFTVVFSEAVNGFSSADVALSQTVGGTSAAVSGSGATYNVAVSGMSGTGAVVATINANAATGSISGIGNLASTSTDNSVTFTLPGSVNVLVPGTADIYLAGRANGTVLGSDSAPTNSPVLVPGGLVLTDGALVAISATGGTNDGYCGNSSPDGGCNGSPTLAATNSLSGVTVPRNALLGVFLNGNVPNGASPAALNFSAVAEQGLAIISPLLNQVFFIGDGLVGTGSLTAQRFTVPAGATRLFLGAADSPGTNVGNLGNFNVTLSIGPLAITSAPATTFREGLAGETFTVTATGSPAPTLSMSGLLPMGLSFSQATGVLSGTPAAGTAGAIPLTVLAHNGVGSDVTQKFILTVTSGGTISSSVTVPGIADLWLAGQPNGAVLGGDSAPTNSPVLGSSGLTLTSGASLTILASGGMNDGYCSNSSPDGGCGGSPALVSPAFNSPGTSLSGITVPRNALLGVFLDNNVPGAAQPPASLNFSSIAEQGKAISSPLLNQVFFIGDGLMGTGSLTPQQFTIPPGATRLFLGAADVPGQNSGNAGSFDVTVLVDPLAITSAAMTTFRVGLAATFVVTATGSPAPTFSRSGMLPNGVAFTPAGVLSGTPAAGSAAAYPITITAHNGVGNDVTQLFMLTVTSGGTISSSVTVSSKADLWLAGQPNGAVLGNDNAPTNSPVLGSSGLNMIGGNFLTISATGGANDGYCADSSPDGGCGGSPGFVSPAFNSPGTSLSGITVPRNALLGVFLDNNVPGAALPPTSLNFSSIAEQGKAISSPLLNQVFFIGDGLMGTGSLTPQQFTVPMGATRLFLGAADVPGQNSDNIGTFNVSVSIGAIAITSVANTTFRVGVAETFTVTTTGSPSLSESGLLPGGVTFNAATGELSGTPGAGTAGPYPITFAAHSGVGDVTQNFTLTVTLAGNVSADFTVPGNADLWLAGQPNGASLGSDSAPTNGAVFGANGLNLIGGNFLTIAAAGGSNDGYCGDSSPDGGCGGSPAFVSPPAGSPGTSLSGITAPRNALLGVFLDNNVPGANPPPVALNFSAAADQGQPVISPLLNQVFFIGDGLRGTGSLAPQQFAIPLGGTRLFLGAADIPGLSNNNAGGFNVTVTLHASVPTPPTVTIHQLAAQSDPTSTSPINFIVEFSETVTGFTNADMTITGTAAGTKTAVVTGSGKTYNVAVSGMTGTGTVIATVNAGGATGSTSGLGNDVSTSTDNSVTFAAGPTVTISPASGQANPAVSSPINFTVVFSEAVTGFTNADVTITGTALGIKTAAVTGSGTTYNVAVSGMTDTGTVIAMVNAGGATGSTSGLGNAASTSTSVTFGVAPTVTINKASGQADPTSTSPINFTVVFSEAMTGFTNADVTISGTAAGTKTTAVAGSGATYNVAVSGMTGAGTVIATVNAGGATGSTSGLGNAASTSISVTFGVAPTVTINQESGQADPASTSPINFTVVFSETVSGFTNADVTITGTTAGTKATAVTGSGATYNVAVSGMTGAGTVIATVNAAGATGSTSGFGNAASTSTDNTVTFNPSGGTALFYYYVWGTADIWLAGQTNGASVNCSYTNNCGSDTAPTNSAVLGSTGLALTGGSSLTIRANGSTNGFAGCASYWPDGAPCGGHTFISPTGTGSSLSGISVPVNALIGVFLNGNVPSGPPPAALDFITNPATRQAATISPLLNQVFFIGDGLTGDNSPPNISGSDQQFIIPAGATRLFLGSADEPGGNWGNTGYFAVGVSGPPVAIAPAVTIDQKFGQTDPAGPSPINFTAVFSEIVTDFSELDVTITGTAAGTKTVTVTGIGTTYNVAVSGMTGAGTVIATVNAGGATGNTSGLGNVASTSTDNSVTFSPLIGGTVRVHVIVPAMADVWLAGQTNGATVTCLYQGSSCGSDTFPTNTPVLGSSGLTLTGGSSLTIGATGWTLGGPSGCGGVGPDGDTCGLSTSVSPTGTGSSLSGINIPSNALIGVFLDSNVPGGLAPAALNFTTPATRSAGTISPLLKQVFFIGDGSTATNGGIGSDQQFTVPAGATRLFLGSSDLPGGNFNNFFGTFNVELRNTAAAIAVPSVTINRAQGQAGSTSTSPINFAVVFSEAVAGFAGSDVTLSGTAGATTAVVTGSGATYNVAVSGMTGSGTVIAAIGAGVATGITSGLGNASFSTNGNIVTFTYVPLKKRGGQITSQ